MPPGGGASDDSDPELTAKRLVDLGLTLNEARCYIALLTVAPATAAQVAELSKIPRTKVYSTLKSLEQRGFSYPSGDRVTRFRPVDPELTLRELTRARRHERQLSDERDSHLREELIDALPTPAQTSPEDTTAEVMRVTGLGGPRSRPSSG